MMSLIRRTMLPTALLVLAAPLAAQRPTLTVARLTSQPSPAGTAPAAPTWSPDSRWLAFLWNDQAQPTRQLWIVGADGAGRQLLRAAGEGMSDVAWAPDSRSLYYLQRGDVWQLPVPAGEPRRLTTDAGDKGELALSPDGRALAFLRDGDLWTLPATGGTPERLTTLAAPPTGRIPLGTYFRRDAEVGSATWGGDAPPFAWAPDGRSIAIHFVDRRAVRQVGFPWYLGDSAVMNVLRRSYPGDQNEVRRIGVVDLATRAIRWVPLADEANVRVVDYSWSPAGALLIDRESDDAIHRWIHLVERPGAEPRLAWHDRRDTRIYNDIASSWHPDGRRIVITGDLEDRYRLYAITPGDTLPRPLTPGTADATGRATPVPAANALFYLANDPSPYERHVWRVGGNGGAPIRLTSRGGHYVPFPSPDGRRMATIFSDDVTPPELYLLDGTGAGSAMTRVTSSPPAEFAAFPWVRPRYVSFPHLREPYTLHARIIEPPNLDRSRKHPVLFGPAYSNTVRNRWGGLNGMVQQLLALEKGYIIVQVDVRGSTGYGREFREKFLMDWGGRDLDDLESAVAYMKTLPHVDPDRFGIWGSSYGGTLTVYSLLRKPGLFRAGVAGAPATDPHFFGSDDVAIARRPQSHPATFLRGAAQYAANLQDHLLIIHGMQDDVVPFKTTVDLAEALIRAGKDFDVAFAPAATHGWTQRPYYARYLLQKLVDHFDRHLGAAAPR